MLLEAPNHASFEAWRDATRAKLIEDQPRSAAIRLPRDLLRVLRNVACYRDDGRWELMTRLVRRSLKERRDLITDIVDPDVGHALRMDQAVRRDLHKMHAFVRFREVLETDGSFHYLAWFEPQHYILEQAAPFFVKRFANCQWTIATPDGTARWDGNTLEIAQEPGVRPPNGADASEALWRTYYRSIANVARLNLNAMRREMPQRYWRLLPEAQEIGPLLRTGQERFERQSASLDLPTRGAISPIYNAESLQQCQRCALWQRATQAVSGQGAMPAALMLVGEQPGDEEDLRGQPFVGPAGKLLDELLRAAGIDRTQIYVTNAVKHFKWEPRGKRRLHKRPELQEIAACRDWLEQEIERCRPRVIVALGASAQQSLLGLRDSIHSSRTRMHQHSSGAQVQVTYHPSAVLRSEPAAAANLRTALTEDLQRALRFLGPS